MMTDQVQLPESRDSFVSPPSSAQCQGATRSPADPRKIVADTPPIGRFEVFSPLLNKRPKQPTSDGEGRQSECERVSTISRQELQLRECR